MKYILLLASLAFGIDSLGTYNTYVDSAIIEAADFNADNDTTRSAYNRLADTIDINFMRFLDFNSGDSTLDTMKINNIPNTVEMNQIDFDDGRTAIIDAGRRRLFVGEAASFAIFDSSYVLIESQRLGSPVVIESEDSILITADKQNVEIISTSQEVAITGQKNVEITAGGLAGSDNGSVIVRAGAFAADSALKVYGKTATDSLRVLGNSEVYDGDGIYSASAFTHPISSVFPTNAYGFVTNRYGGSGNLFIAGCSNNATTEGFTLQGTLGSINPNDDVPAVEIIAQKYDGGTSQGALGNDEKVLGVMNRTTEVFNILGDGDATFIGNVTADSLKGAIDISGPISGTIATYDTVISTAIRVDTLRSQLAQPVKMYSAFPDVLTVVSAGVAAINLVPDGSTTAARFIGYANEKDLEIVVNGTVAIDVDSNQVVSVSNALYGLEPSGDPAAPGTGQYVIWVSNGVGKGSEGDVMIASESAGSVRYTTLFDHSTGTAW